MALLSCTFRLVTVDEQVSTVLLAHFTLQEYLSTYPALFTTLHSMMAKICLTYLHFRSICELSTTLDTITSTATFLPHASFCPGLYVQKEMTEGLKTLAIQLQVLERDANQISSS